MVNIFQGWFPFEPGKVLVDKWFTELQYSCLGEEVFLSRTDEVLSIGKTWNKETVEKGKLNTDSMHDWISDKRACFFFVSCSFCFAAAAAAAF